MRKRKSKEIFAAALLELAKKEPVEKITVKQIVETSGLSLQTFYNHFHDKEDLIFWIHRSEGERTLAKLAGKKYNFHELTLDNTRVYAENANYLRSSMSSGVLNPYAEITAENAIKVLGEYICRRTGMEELPEDVLFYLRMYIFSSLHIYAEWALNAWDIPPERLARYLEDGMPDRLKPLLLD